MMTTPFYRGTIPLSRGAVRLPEKYISHTKSITFTDSKITQIAGGQTVVRVVLEDLSGLGTSIRTMAGPYVTLALIVGPPL